MNMYILTYWPTGAKFYEVCWVGFQVCHGEVDALLGDTSGEVWTLDWLIDWLFCALRRINNIPAI